MPHITRKCLWSFNLIEQCNSLCPTLSACSAKGIDRSGPKSIALVSSYKRTICPQLSCLPRHRSSTVSLNFWVRTWKMTFPYIQCSLGLRVVLRRACCKIGNVGKSKVGSDERRDDPGLKRALLDPLSCDFRLSCVFFFVVVGRVLVFSARGMHDCSNHARDHFCLSILACFAGLDEWRQALFW